MTPYSVRIKNQKSLLRGLLISVCAGAVLAFSGAFGSLVAPLWLRLAYWIPLIVLGSFWSFACSRIVERFVDIDAKPWLGTGLLSLLMSLPITLMVWCATIIIFHRQWPPLSALPQFFVPVLVITLPLCALNVFLGKSQPVETHATATKTEVRFLQRLPVKLRGSTLLAVQSEDHYLRLHTDRGSDLILMRLSDALEELDGLEGSQTHRSWWVAKDAVRDVTRGDGRASLTLTDGTVAPVSRRFAPALREAGWW